MAYLGLGSLVMTLFMGYHLKNQKCGRSTAYHIIEAMLGALLWPLYVLFAVGAGIWLYWNHQRHHH